ncbi:MAG: alpha/beta hydrolase, partial [Propionibacteriaceae bacterium]|nr:alpha/beta hydrolase [Propionibacteriaceae bacterium]
MTDPWDNLYDPELAALIAWCRQRALPSGPFPDLAPAPGQDRAEWAQAVAVVRARHDAGALVAGQLSAAILPAPPAAWARVSPRWCAIEVAGGVIGAQVYRPEGPGPFPIVLLIHGGAFWMGGGAAGFHLNDRLCRQITAEVGAVTVTVDHRLAPEHPYPTPLEDTYQAILWAVEQAGQLEADPGRLALFGISSGGNLACAAAQLSLDRGGPSITAQVLQCPSLDLSWAAARFEADSTTVAGAEAIIRMYAAGADCAGAPVSPGLRQDLSQTPPTLLVTAQFDHLAGDALAYARRLEAAGRPVTTHCYPMTHTVATPAVFTRMHHQTMAWL